MNYRLVRQEDWQFVKWYWYIKRYDWNRMGGGISSGRRNDIHTANTRVQRLYSEEL